MKIMVSACLIGENCKYNGGNNLNAKVLALMEEHEIVPVCPEVMGGLPTPRSPIEIRGDAAVTQAGGNVDEQCRKGAQRCLEVAAREQPDLVILQSRSPSCGVKQRYDGSFSGTLIDGSGVAARLLTENGFKVMDVADLSLPLTLETERLVLRPWTEADAEECFRYAKDPRIGPIAGWPAHTNVEDSRLAIRTILSAPEIYAIIWRESGLPIGCIGLQTGALTDLSDKEDECELGYWLGAPYWGQGIVPEAARELLRHAFEDLGMKKVWCGHYDGNTRSKRVQEKCGFRYRWTTDEVDVPQMHEKRIGHVSCLTREEWLAGEGRKDSAPFGADEVEGG